MIAPQSVYPEPGRNPDEVFQAVRDHIYNCPLRPVPEAAELATILDACTADVAGALEALDVERGAA